jgi:formylglycine-generating enzyme required for sulfatase activity
MTKKQTQVKSRRFIPAFSLFLLTVFLFSSCPQPEGGDTGTGEPPAVPAAPELRPGNGALFLSWTAVPGADSYAVYCGETEPGEGASPVQTVNVPAASITGLVNGTSYYVRLRAENSAGLSGFSPSAAGTPRVQLPAPSVIRGDGELSVGWAAEEGVDYEVWYGTSGDSGAAQKWAGTTTLSGLTAGTVISGLSNGTARYVWIKIVSGETASGFSAGTAGTPEAAKTVEEGLVYIPGGTVSGSGVYAVTVTVPKDPAYNNPGSSSVQKGVFVADRVVSLDSFAMAKYETTQELWFAVQEWALGQGYYFQNKKSAPPEAQKSKPVTGLSWRDAVVWCNAYSEKTGLEPVYRDSGGNVIKDSRDANGAVCDNAVMDKSKTGYRLPTEVEREYAARGGDPGRPDWMYVYAGSDNADAVAWHHGNSPYQTQAVGQKNANSLGVFDLSGNVQEWCWDWMNYAVDVTADTPEDGAAHNQSAGGKNIGNQKPLPGGGAGSNITMSCVAYRWGYNPDYKDAYIGFRVICKL